MKITPLEIRQKTFEKKLRGYDKDEVNAFLQSLSQEWERMIDVQKELKIKLDASEREVSKLREVESSLFKTLKTAEDTGANMIQQANKTAELHLRETQMNADGLLNEAKSKAKKVTEDALDRSQKTLEETEKKIRELHQVYRNLEMHRDALLSDIKHFAQDSLEKVDKIISKSHNLDIDQVLSKIQEQKAETSKELPKARPMSNQENHPSPEKNEAKPISEAEPKKKSSGSFFDEIE